MSLRSALAGAAGTAAVLAALGNPAVVDAGRDEGSRLATSVTGFASWDVFDGPGDVAGFVALRLGVTVVAAGLLAGVAGQSRSRAAAWIAGWGAVIVGAALGAVAGYVYLVPVVLDGRSYAATWADGLVDSADAGASFGLWTGWLVGLLVAAATRPVGAWDGLPVAADTGVVPAGSPPADPPPPWWAPAIGATDPGVHPGPTAFPPGGFGPVVAGVGEPVPPIPAPQRGATHELTTASGDPHPSDPDATRAVGLPADSPTAGSPTAHDPDTCAPDAGDPDAHDPSGDPDAGDPTAGDPTAHDPTAHDPTAGDPDAGDPDAHDPSGDPDAGDPTAGDPTAHDPTAGDPAGDPTAGDPDAGDRDATAVVEAPAGDHTSRLPRGDA